jgi:two-component system sensor histidine kinase KdpD
MPTPPILTRAITRRYPRARWRLVVQRLAADCLLIALGIAAVSALIATLHLYPRVHNVSILYLLVVLALAVWRDRLSAIVAAVVAFLAFDLLFIPPLYTLTVSDPSEWLALAIFLIVAIIAGTLAANLHERAQEAQRRAREATLLYEFARLMAAEPNLERLLPKIAERLLQALPDRSILSCAFLLPEAGSRLVVRGAAGAAEIPAEQEREVAAAAQWVLEHGEPVALPCVDRAQGAGYAPQLRFPLFGVPSARRSVRLLPLLVGSRAVGVLRLIEEPRADTLKPDDATDAERMLRGYLDQIALGIERARLRREEVRAEVLQRTDQLRSALLSSVSHDLRTPLASIKAAAGSLQQQDVLWDEDARREFAGAIEREADRLNRLVSNLLDMSRIEAGALHPDKEWYSLGELIQEVLDRLAPTLEGREVTISLAPDLPPVPLDYLQIDQVLTNLIENAIHYTGPGTPITVTAERSGSEVLVQVADHGPGIPPQDLERIFDKFYRVGPSGLPGTEPRVQGSGLGLAVARGLIEAHGGRLWAANRPGGGALFTFTLPLS